MSFNNLLSAKSNDLWAFWEQNLEAIRVTKEELPNVNLKSLVVFRWNRSKDFCMWDDETELESQMNIRAFGYDVKIGLLNDWLPKIKL